MNKPNLFIVGMPRAGTTSMHEYLGQHPEIFMSHDSKSLWFEGKEPHFFGSDLILNPWTPPRTTQEQYDALFKSAHEKIVGESSTSYLNSQKAADEIYAFNPRAKILISIRNPVDQCYSLHCLHIAEDLARKTHIKNLDFAHALEEVENKDNMGWFRQGSDYKKNIINLPENIRRYQKNFGKENVKIISFDDLQADTATVYKEILEFLGVATDFAPRFVVHNSNKELPKNWFTLLYVKLRSLTWLLNIKRAVVPNLKVGKLFYKNVPRQQIPHELRAKLTAEFRPVVEELEKMSGYDLSKWK